MFILPTEPIRNRVISGRIDKMVSKVPLYRENIGRLRKDVDSKSLKSVFGTTWNYVGSQSPENFYEFDADIIIVDEYNRCDQVNLLLAAERTGAARYDRFIYVGNPSLPGWGIDGQFDLSTMNRWLIKCDSCNAWQALDWFENFIDQRDDGTYFLRSTSRLDSTGGDASAVCRSCHKDLDRLKRGAWVPEYPERDIAGFHVTKLFGLPGTDFPGQERPIILELFEIWKNAQANQTALELFYNNQLGITYSAKGNYLSLDLMAECADENYSLPAKAKNTIAGMDVGKVHHLHISEVVTDENGRRRRKKVFVGFAQDWEDAQRIIDLYGADHGVVDAQGEIHAPREWVQNNPGWVMCWYSRGAESVKDEASIDYGKNAVKCNRTESLDASYAAYSNGDVILPVDWQSLDGGDFVKQMQAPIRKFKESPGELKGRYIWDEGAKPDHHRHADNYELLAMALLASPKVHFI